MPEPAPKKKKVSCLECEKDFDLDDNDGVCPDCSLNMGAILERDRHERALAKLRQQSNKGSKKKSGPFSW